MKKTLILGATSNPERYAYLAAQRLLNHGHPIVLLGIRPGEVLGEPILTGRPELHNIDTITLYVNPTHQKEWYDYLIGLKPKRIIFNPGTENPEFIQMAQKNGIEPVVACTLVMLSARQY